MTITPPFMLSRHDQLISVAGRSIYKGLSSFGQSVEVHVHPEFGNCLFIDGEIQISEFDYEPYHQAMLSFVPVGSKILVVGDGDGGFTNRPDWKVFQIEPDSEVMEAARRYFGAKWQETERFTLCQTTLDQYVRTVQNLPNPPTQFDAVFLAITDEFNSNPDNFRDVVYLWNSLLKSGGCMVAQVGCVDDPNYAEYLDNYHRFEAAVGPCTIEDRRVDIKCFHSVHHFRCFYKS